MSVTTSIIPNYGTVYKGIFNIQWKEIRGYRRPGTYQLNPEAESEKAAADMVEEGDILVNVVDSTNLERNLIHSSINVYEKPMVFALNMG